MLKAIRQIQSTCTVCLIELSNTGSRIPNELMTSNNFLGKYLQHTQSVSVINYMVENNSTQFYNIYFFTL